MNRKRLEAFIDWELTNIINESETKHNKNRMHFSLINYYTNLIPLAILPVSAPSRRAE